MASEDRSEATREGLSAAKRKRVGNYFDHARKHMAQDGYDFDYATDLLTQCVTGDLATVEYLEAFLGNLQRKYNNNRKGQFLGFLSSAGARNGMKKALAQKDWDAAIKNALDVLKLNPWDTGALCGLATVAENLGPEYDKSELKCLKSALDSKPKDIAINKQCASALERRGEYDQAVACLHRIEKIKPDDEEIRRAISRLTVLKQQVRTGVAEDPTASRSSGDGSRGQAAQASESSPEQRLKRQITQNPQELDGYRELADLYLKAERYADAEPVLAKALEISNGDSDIRERLYETQRVVLQRREEEAKKRAESGDEEAQQEYRRARKRHRMKELEVHKLRCERYPLNLLFKYDLAATYQALGEYSEAIKLFQMAKNEPRRKSACLLALGQCFQHIKQLRLAMNHFELALAEIPERDVENRKVALYNTGRLAIVLKDKETANKYLTELAQLDFGYRDVSDLLAKIDKLDKADKSEKAAEETSEESPPAD